MKLVYIEQQFANCATIFYQSPQSKRSHVPRTNFVILIKERVSFDCRVHGKRGTKRGNVTARANSSSPVQPVANHDNHAAARILHCRKAYGIRDSSRETLCTRHRFDQFSSPPWITTDLTDCIISFICYFSLVTIDSCADNGKSLFEIKLYMIKYLDRILNFNDF